MKKTLIIIFAVAAGLILSSSNQATAQNGIANSPHDFTDGAGFDSDSWSGLSSADSICGVCHTPHNAQVTELAWNHAPSSASYTDDLQTGFGTTWGSPDGPSLLCLSCHDGTIALDNFGGVTGGTGIKITGNLQIGSGSSLAGNHPISVTYDDTIQLVNGVNEFVEEATVDASNIRLYGSPGNFKIQCGSCHDVHNRQTVSGTKLLRVSAGSLCTTCHDK